MDQVWKLLEESTAAVHTTQAQSNHSEKTNTTKNSKKRQSENTENGGEDEGMLFYGSFVHTFITAIMCFSRIDLGLSCLNLTQV